MADIRKKATVEVRAEDKTKAAFGTLGKNMGALEKKSGGLASSFGTLVKAAAGLFIFKQVADFIGKSVKAAGIQETMNARLAAGLKGLTGATNDQVKALISYAGELQKVTMYADEQIIAAQGILSTFQLTSEQIREATARVVDMAAGTERATGEQQDLTTIAMALGRALTMGVGALTRYGVVLSDSEKAAILAAKGNEKLMLILEALDKNYKGIAEAMGRTYAGQLKMFQNQWGDFQEQIGFGVLPVLGETIKALSNLSGEMGKGTSASLFFFDALGAVAQIGMLVTNWYRKLGVAMENVWLSAEIGQEKLKGLLFWYEANEEYIAGLSRAILENDKRYEDLTVEMGKFLLALDEQRKNIIKGKETWEDSTSAIGGNVDAMGEAGDETEDLAKKIKTAFESVGKTIVSKMTESIEKIADLRKEIRDLASDTEEALAKQDEAYKEDLANMARSAQEKINIIDKEIADEQKLMSQGWRGRIAELEKEKAKEQSVLDRIRGEGVDASAEALKDELTLLQEANQKKRDEIAANAEKEAAEKETRISEIQVSATKAGAEAMKPGGIESLVSREMAAKPWETSPTQAIFNINVAGDIVSEDQLLTKLINELNRLAGLKQFSGQ